MSNLNRLANTKNQYQGTRKKVLAVCSAGLLRSPTIAWVLSNKPFDFNTRACGITSEYALIPLDEVLVTWADEVVVVEDWMKDIVQSSFPEAVVHVVETPDMYPFRDEKLVDFLTPKLKELFLENPIA
jgi:predicted protein tyrosine phosphatase